MYKIFKAKKSMNHITKGKLYQIWIESHRDWIYRLFTDQRKYDGISEEYLLDVFGDWDKDEVKAIVTIIEV